MANGLFEMGDRDLFDKSDYGFQYDQDKLFDLKDKIRNGVKLTDAEMDLYRKLMEKFDPETIQELDELERLKIKQLNEGLTKEEQDLLD